MCSARNQKSSWKSYEWCFCHLWDQEQRSRGVTFWFLNFGHLTPPPGYFLTWLCVCLRSFTYLPFVCFTKKHDFKLELVLKISVIIISHQQPSPCELYAVIPLIFGSLDFWSIQAFRHNSIVNWPMLISFEPDPYPWDKEHSMSPWWYWDWKEKRIDKRWI